MMLFKKKTAPALSEALADRMLENIFDTCQAEPNTIPLKTLISYTRYRRERFSLSAMVDIKGKRRILKTNLIDYLENHLSGRISVTEQDYERLYGPGSLGEEIATGGKAGRRQRTSGRRTVELMPIRSRAVQPEETGDRLDREVFSVENAAHEKPGEKVLPQRPEDPARVTEEELQALLQELLTV